MKKIKHWRKDRYNVEDKPTCVECEYWQDCKIFGHDKNDPCETFLLQQAAKSIDNFLNDK